MKELFGVFFWWMMVTFSRKEVESAMECPGFEHKGLEHLPPSLFSLQGGTESHVLSFDDQVCAAALCF